MDDARRSDSPAAILIFADSQQRDLRRRALPAAALPLLALPRFGGLNGRADVHWFTDRPRSTGGSARIHRQRGRCFGERLENAVADLASIGYRRIVIVGRDCPQLSSADVACALDLLDSGKRLVVGPDHRGGCWLIAFNTADRKLLHRIDWQRDTDAAALVGRVAASDVELLETKFDLDGADDVILLARHYLPAAAVAQLLSFGCSSVRRDTPADVRRRIAHQLPPPRAPGICRCA